MSFSLEPIINSLLLTPFAKQKGEEYIYVRCPLCGDSTKHKDGAHCSIWVRTGQPLIYHCWICEESGLVDQKFLNLLDIDDNEILNQVDIYNKSSMKRRTSKFKVYNKDYEFQIPMISDNELHKAKLNYMIERIGVPFTYKILEALKIVFSLEDYLVLNKVKVNPKYKNFMYSLNRNYIGFVSTTNDYVNLRSIEKDPKIRYMKYHLFEDMIGSEQFYMVPSKVDIFGSDIDLRVAEGPFDILGVLFNVMGGKLENQIYCAVGGSGYIRVIQYLLRKGFMTNLNLYIYSDSDKNIHFYDHLIHRYQSWLKSIHIIYNGYKGEKDFGVPKSRIIPKEYNIN